MSYTLARRALFALDPEQAHDLTLDMVGAAGRTGLAKLFCSRVPALPTTVMGIKFPNPVGLAAGLDKNADAFQGFAGMGFGFVEVGTVTPRPQPGNPKPRLFRLPEHEAIINRMGFNNKGVEYLVERVKRRDRSRVLGINIGKNFDTPVERAVDDYLACLTQVYDYADYITVNISSPNTPGLRTLQYGESLIALLRPLKVAQQKLAEESGHYRPLVVKIAPDMTDEEVRSVADVLRGEKLDGVIATNTTLDREAVAGSPHASEAGGLSGAPVREKSTHVIGVLADALEGELPVIGVGGICSGDDAAEKITAGASLVQVYSGFIYKGPALIKEAVEAISASTAFQAP